MMNSYRQNSPKRGPLIVATLFILLVFALDVMSDGGVRSLVRASYARISHLGSQAALAIAGSGFFSSNRTLLRENESLKQRIVDLELRLSSVRTVEDENTRLRSLVHLAEDTPGITAPIASSFLSSPYGTFMLGVGNSNGIGVGHLVIASGGGSSRGFVIGRVTQVSKDFALATQILAPDISTEAVINDTPLVVLGRGGGNARAEAPRGIAIAKGDVVIAPRFHGMPIGVVGSVSQDAASASQTVYIGLPVSLAALRFVYVIP